MTAAVAKAVPKREPVLLDEVLESLVRAIKRVEAQLGQRRQDWHRVSVVLAVHKEAGTAQCLLCDRCSRPRRGSACRTHARAHT